MSRSVYKYSVPVDDQAHPYLVSGGLSQIVHVESQYSYRSVEFWVDSDLDAAQVTRTFRVYGTGHLVPRDALYIGSAVTASGNLVWHLFEHPNG